MTDIEEIVAGLEEELKTAQEDKNRLFAPVFKSGVIHGLETAILRIAVWQINKELNDEEKWMEQIL